MRITGSRSLTVVLGLALLGSLAPWAHDLSSARTDTCPQVEDGELARWTRRAAPSTPSGRDRITAHAVNPTDPTHHLITDGVSILRSTDDGCTWESTFTLPDEPTPTLPTSAETDRVLELVAHPAAPERMWAIVAVGQAVANDLDLGLLVTPAARERRDITSTLVLRSDDGGGSWAPAGAPALLPGAPMRLAPAPSDPETAYLALNGTLYVTSDGGTTWIPRPTVLASVDSAGSGDLTPIPYDLAVHPHEPTRLLSRTLAHAFRSSDEAHTWTRLPPEITNAPSGPYVERFDAAAEGLRALYVHQVLADAHPRALFRYREEAGDLQELPLPDEAILGAPLDAVWHPHRDEVLLATWQNNIPSDRFDRVGLYLLDLSAPRDGEPEAVVSEIDELGLAPLSGVDVDATGGYHVHNQAELVTLRTDGHASPEAGRDDASRCQAIDDVPELLPAEPPAPESATLAAPDGVVAEGGGRVSTEAVLELPADPGLLDVYLLLDTSNGFRDDLGDVARSMAGVAGALVDAGVDLQVGVGGLGTADTYRYRRIRDIGPVGPELRDALAGLCARGSYESHLISLHQTATGLGLPERGPRRPAVPSGQDPTWRDESLRTVVMVTDNEFDDRTLTEADPDAPPRGDVFDVFEGRGLRFIGVEVVRDVTTPLPSEGQEGTPGWLAAVEAADAAGETAPTPAREDMEALASATGTFAPAGGVDCRGTGRRELAEGDPLVCATFSTSASGPVAGESTMGDVLRRVLLAQPDVRPVRLVVTDHGDAEVEVVDDGRQVDVRRDHVAEDALTFPLQVGCPDERAGEEHEIAMAAEVDGREVAATTMTVTCSGTTAVPPGPPLGDAAAPGDSPRAGPGEPAPDPGPPATSAPPSAAPGSPIAVPGSASAPAPGAAPGHGVAPGSATSPGGTPSHGSATTGGSAASPATGASAATSAPAGAGGTAPGVSSSGAGAPAPGVAGPESRSRPGLGVAGAPSGHQLAFSTRTEAPARMPTVALLAIAAAGFSLALTLGAGRRGAARLGGAPRRPRRPPHR
jgi:hypothetical protein